MIATPQPIGAVGTTLRVEADNAINGASAATQAGADFGAILADVASSTKNALTQAEQVSLSALQGKATVRDVVDSVMKAEQTLQTALALRDKTVAAVQEITRMSI